MANPNRGEVVLFSGAKEYVLSFSINALCELEDLLGSSVIEIAAQLNDRSAIQMKTIRAMVWAGLRDKHSECSLTDAGTIITQAGVPETLAAIGSAFSAAFPDAPAEAKGSGSRPRKGGGG